MVLLMEGRALRMTAKQWKGSEMWAACRHGEWRLKDAAMQSHADDPPASMHAIIAIAHKRGCQALTRDREKNRAQGGQA